VGQGKNFSYEILTPLVEVFGGYVYIYIGAGGLGSFK